MSPSHVLEVAFWTFCVGALLGVLPFVYLALAEGESVKCRIGALMAECAEIFPLFFLLALYSLGLTGLRLAKVGWRFSLREVFVGVAVALVAVVAIAVSAAYRLPGIELETALKAALGAVGISSAFVVVMRQISAAVREEGEEEEDERRVVVSAG